MALKDFAQQNVTRISFVEESVAGTTPASPSMRIIPVVSSGLEVTKTTITSSALNSNRQKRFSRHGNRQTGGDIVTDFAYQTFDPLLRGAMMSNADFAGPVDGPFITIGSKKWYFTFEEGQFGQASPNYKRFSGCLINGVTFSVQQDGIISSTWSVIGSDMVSSTSPLDATPGVGGNEQLVNTPFVHKEAAILVNGVELGIIASFEFSLMNGITPTFTIGNDVAVAHGYADATVEGTMTVYIENNTIYNYFLNETEVDISITMDAPDTGAYRFDMSKVKINSATQAVGGEGPRQMQVNFEALFNDTDASTLRVTKLPNE